MSYEPHEKNSKGWPQVHYMESSGQSYLGMQLFADLGRELNDNDKEAIWKAMGSLQKDLLAESARIHPDNIAWKERWLIVARKTFEDAKLAPVYMKEIPNEYCGPLCCPHRVWLLVTTPVGVIKIGWRKSVMVIDWSQSDIQKEAEELFASEDVTKGERMIHAWGYEKATEYLTKIGQSK